MADSRELPKYDLIPIGGRNLNGATFIPQVASPSYSPSKAFRPNKIFRSIASHYSTTLGQEKKKVHENRKFY